MDLVFAPPTSLQDLADTINREHSLAYAAALDALDHAIKCGEALIEARATVPDGQWGQWVADNLNLSSGTFHRYIRLATYQEALLSAESQPKSVNAAIGYLKGIGAPAAGTSRTGRQPTFDVDEARRLRDQGMKYTEIGPILGVSDVAVWRQLTPGATAKAMQHNSRAAKRRRAERKALEQKERDEAVARVGGTPAEAYAMLRKCALVLDRAITETDDVEMLESLRNALAETHRAEDSIVRALQIERVAS